MSARCLKIRFVSMALIQVNELEEAPTKIEAGATTVNASIGKLPEESQPVFGDVPLFGDSFSGPVHPRIFSMGQYGKQVCKNLLTHVCQHLRLQDLCLFSRLTNLGVADKPARDGTSTVAIVFLNSN